MTAMKPLLALLTLCLSVSASSIEQIAIPQGAYHVATADVDGDGDDELICACFHGEIVCLDSDSSEIRWTRETGGFPFDLAARDIDGDGRAEVFVASADCSVYAIGPRWPADPPA